MPLRIIQESDPIEITQLIACFHSVPGIGKTSLGFSADDPLLLDFDRGAHRSKNRRQSSRLTWEEAEGITESDLSGYKTVVIDTVGRALDALTIDIIRNEPKLGRGGTLSIQGFGVLRARFIGWMNMLRSMRRDVILLAHSDEQRKGDETIERLDVQGGSKGEIYKCSDLMGRIYIRDGARYLNCNPSETSFGKNPAQLDVEKIPDFADEPNYLGSLLRRVKEKINEQTETQRIAAAFLNDWRDRIEQGCNPDDFNGLREALKEVDNDPVLTVLKRMVGERARSLGIAFDKKADAFVQKVA